MPLSAELLEPSTPSFQTWTHNPTDFKPDWRLLFNQSIIKCSKSHNKQIKLLALACWNLTNAKPLEITINAGRMSKHIPCLDQFDQETALSVLQQYWNHTIIIITVSHYLHIIIILTILSIIIIIITILSPLLPPQQTTHNTTPPNHQCVCYSPSSFHSNGNFHHHQYIWTIHSTTEVSPCSTLTDQKLNSSP